MVRGGGGELLRDVRIFDVYRRRAGGEGRRSIAMHLTFRARRPHADRRGGQRSASTASCATPHDRSGRSRVPELTAIVAGASGYTGALAAALLHRHPASSSWR